MAQSAKQEYMARRNRAIRNGLIVTILGCLAIFSGVFVPQFVDTMPEREKEVYNANPKNWNRRDKYGDLVGPRVYREPTRADYESHEKLKEAYEKDFEGPIRTMFILIITGYVLFAAASLYLAIKICTFCNKVPESDDEPTHNVTIIYQDAGAARASVPAQRDSYVQQPLLAPQGSRNSISKRASYSSVIVGRPVALV